MRDYQHHPTLRRNQGQKNTVKWNKSLKQIHYQRVSPYNRRMKTTENSIKCHKDFIHERSH